MQVSLDNSMHRLIQKILNFIGWSISSFFLLTGFVGLFLPDRVAAIFIIVWGLIFLPPFYYRMTKRYGWKKNILWRIVIFFVLPIFITPWLPPSQHQASNPEKTSIQAVSRARKTEMQKPISVSPEYKMFRTAGASPEKAQALKDACTVNKTCPKTLEIAKGVVKGEITLGLVSNPDQPCTEDEFKKSDKIEGADDFCYYKSAEGRKAFREAEAARKTQEYKPSAESPRLNAYADFESLTIAAERYPNNKVLAAKAEKARLEVIVANGASVGISRAESLCRLTVRTDENDLVIEECDAEGNKHPWNYLGNHEPE